MDVLSAFNVVRNEFPSTAFWQGTHFKYAHKNGVWIDEKKIGPRFFYWIRWEGNVKLIHASQESKFSRLRTIGDSFSPSLAYD